MRGRHYWELFLLPEEAVMRDGSLISWDNTGLFDEQGEVAYTIGITEGRRAGDEIRG